MKSKIVLWGANAQDEKILVAVALRAEDNKVDIWTFPESVATEDFYQVMMKEWRDGAGLELPEPHTHMENELSVTGSLLPDDIKVERTDVIQRAQTEWHFIVLSSKLHQAYEDELSELTARVEKLESFDQSIWDNLKEYWDKLQEQVRERNLFREHADTLRDNANVLFGKMKELRSKMDEEFENVSKDVHEKFMQALQDIQNKVKEGGRLASLFDELKKLQVKFRDANLTREHRAQVWDKLNAAFKEVKSKRPGNRTEEGASHYQRLKRRYDGLMSAIDKMEQSIRRDRNDLDFQQHKIDNTDGQLEAQLRQAKILMIEERIRSKEEKLGEMHATQVDLEARLATQKERDERREAHRDAKKSVKEKIAGEIKAAAEAREDVAEKLEKAAEEIVTAKTDGLAAAKKKAGSMLDTASTALSESLEDVVDTIKAVASVVSDKIEDVIEDITEELTGEEEDTAEKAKEEAPAAAAEIPVSEEPEAVVETPVAETENEEELVEESAAAGGKKEDK